jgi:hypothetical protein
MCSLTRPICINLFHICVSYSLNHAGAENLAIGMTTPRTGIRLDARTTAGAASSAPNPVKNKRRFDMMVNAPHQHIRQVSGAIPERPALSDHTRPYVHLSESGRSELVLPMSTPLGEATLLQLVSDPDPMEALRVGLAARASAHR